VQRVSGAIDQVDIVTLQLLCRKDGIQTNPDPDPPCSYIKPRMSKKQTCGTHMSRIRIDSFMLIQFLDSLHANGRGTMVKTECGVKFDIYIPCSWDRFPFIMLTCRGRHSHFPPPPSKLPFEIGKQIVEVIRSHDVLGLTASKY
jgi:hypothetical protein